MLNPVAAAAAQASSLAHVAHRTYPLPDRDWLIGQTWLELLFAHWPVPVEALRPHVPDGLDLDTFDGSAWLGVTPFRVDAVRLRGALPPPVGSGFRELNVRTYVTRDGRPGIWFFSLDASSRVAVATARRLYRLPYFQARIECHRDGEQIGFRSVRVDGRPARFTATYRPSGDVFHAEPGTLEHFLTERYCLYAGEGRRLYRTDIHHLPWPLQPADAGVRAATMPPEGIELPDRAPLLHFAARLDVVIWRPEPLAAN